MSDSEDLATLGMMGLVGLAGYKLSASQYANWEPIIKSYKDRLNHLCYLKIVIPYSYFEQNKTVNSYT